MIFLNMLQYSSVFFTFVDTKNWYNCKNDPYYEQYRIYEWLNFLNLFNCRRNLLKKDFKCYKIWNYIKNQKNYIYIQAKYITKKNIQRYFEFSSSVYTRYYECNY